MDKPGTPHTIADYIDAAPALAQPHLHCVYRILKQAAPDAQEAIKWARPSSSSRCRNRWCGAWRSTD